LAAALVLHGFAAADAAAATAERAPSQVLLTSLEDPDLARLATEVLADHPPLAAAAAEARALRSRAPQVSAWPDPQVGSTLFLSPPETRVGAQRWMVSVSQRLPWLDRLDLDERSAVLAAEAAERRVEAMRLQILTRVRELWVELAFVDRQREILEELRDHLSQHEELARSRYSVGRGGDQGVVRLQAEITRAEQSLLDLDLGRVDLEAELAALTGAPLGGGVARPGAADLAVLVPAPELIRALAERRLGSLAATALANRPEIEAQALEIARLELMEETAAIDGRPDVSVGLTYTLVEDRDDPAGRAAPPPDDGRDVFGLTASVRLPVWREVVAAGVAERTSRTAQARASRRALEDQIGRAVRREASRLPLLVRELSLVEDLLLVQAHESVTTAAAAYAAGQGGSLDLYEAEHMSFEARTAAARLRADLALAVARLEGALGAPLESVMETENQP
jgi:outer membrane protein TolC